MYRDFLCHINAWCECWFSHINDWYVYLFNESNIIYIKSWCYYYDMYRCQSLIVHILKMYTFIPIYYLKVHLQCQKVVFFITSLSFKFTFKTHNEKGTVYTRKMITILLTLAFSCLCQGEFTTVCNKVLTGVSWEYIGK